MTSGQVSGECPNLTFLHCINHAKPSHFAGKTKIKRKLFYWNMDSRDDQKPEIMFGNTGNREGSA